MCDECHKDILCFDLTSASLDAIVVTVGNKPYRTGERMTRKDYILIAKAFRQAQEDNYGDSSANAGIEYASDLLADALAKENPRFDKDKFIKACVGITTPNGGKFWVYSGRS